MSEFEHSGVKISEERQQTIIDEWNNRPSSPPSLKEMVQLAFPDVDEKYQDGRSK